MREAIGYTAFLVSMAAAYAGAAEPMLRNVPGFDPGLLAGKICQDTFDTGRRRPPAIRPWSEGALQLRFAANGGVLTAHMSIGQEIGLYCTTTLGRCGGRETREGSTTPI